MTCGLVHAGYSLPKWQAVKLTFFAPCNSQLNFDLYCKEMYACALMFTYVL